MWASHSDFLNVRFQLAIQAFPSYIYIFFFLGESGKTLFVTFSSVERTEIGK